MGGPADPPRRGPRRPRAAQAAAQLLDPLRGRGAQRGLAVRLHPLAPRRRQRGRDRSLARRPLPLPARLHGVPAGRRRRRGGHLHRRRRRPRLARRHAHRQRRRLHGALHRRPQRLRVPARLPRRPPEERRAGPSRRPRARSSASTRPSSAGSAGSRRRADLAALQAQLDAFRARLQRAAAAPGDRAAHAGRGLPPRCPRRIPPGAARRGHFRLRYDTTDSKGAITLRRAGRLHHLKVGAAHARRRVLAIVDEQEVTVVALDTGEVLSTHRIEPDKGYWRNTRRDPGRWPGSPRRPADHRCRRCRDSCVADVATQDSGGR